MDKRVKNYPMPISMGEVQKQVVAIRVERSGWMLRYLGVEST